MTAFISTRDRVPASTAPDLNRRIARDAAARIAYFAQHREAIPARLRELDEEWDIERAIEANASALAVAGLALGSFSNRKWLVVPGLVAGFLFQHAIQGWCPPVPVLRRLGFRTSDEINQERYALKALHGDFERLSLSNSPESVSHAVGLNGASHSGQNATPLMMD